MVVYIIIVLYKNCFWLSKSLVYSSKKSHCLELLGSVWISQLILLTCFVILSVFLFVFNGVIFWSGALSDGLLHFKVTNQQSVLGSSLVDLIWWSIYRYFKHLVKHAWWNYFPKSFMILVWLGLNPLSFNPTKWSNTLKQFVGNSQRIVWVCLTILWGWRVKG